MTGLEYADDIAILTNKRNVQQQMTTEFEKAAAKVGLRISREKTKVMQIGRQQCQQIPITVAQQPVEEVNQFTYLGSIISNNGDVEADINYRIGKAATTFQRMRSIWRSKAINRRTKLQL